MKTSYYSLTVKYNALQANQVQEHHYQSFMQYNSHKGLDVVCHAFEQDKKGRLHLHGIIYAPFHLYIRKFLLPGYHVRIDPLYTLSDLNRYLSYVGKCQTRFKKQELSILMQTHLENFQCPIEVKDPLDKSTDECLFDI